MSHCNFYSSQKEKINIVFKKVIMMIEGGKCKKKKKKVEQGKRTGKCVGWWHVAALEATVHWK